jgi:hypothetical protein
LVATAKGEAKKEELFNRAYVSPSIHKKKAKKKKKGVATIFLSLPPLFFFSLQIFSIDLHAL